MQTFKKYLKRILLILSITIAAFVLFLVVIGFFYGEKVKQLIVAEISKELNVEVSVKQINFSLFSNFPNASVDFIDIKTIDKSNIQDAPLLKAGKLSLLFDIFDIFWGDYNIEKIVLKDASLNLVVTDEQVNNFNIFQKKQDNKKAAVEINLQKVILHDVLVSYLDQKADQEYVFMVKNGTLKGVFFTHNYLLIMDGNIFSNHFRSGKKMYFQNQELKVAINMAIDHLNSIYTLKEAKMIASGITVDVEGSIQSQPDNSNLNLTIRTDKSSISSLLKLLPDDWKENLKKFPVFGNFTLNAKIEGKFSGDMNPHISCDFILDNGEFRHTASGLIFKNISFKGNFDNGKFRTEETYSLNLSGLSAGINAGEVKGELTITNFAKPIISATLTSDLNLNKLNEILRIEALESISGNMKFNLKFTNHLKNLNKFTINDFISSQTSGTMSISNMDIHLKNNPSVYSNLNGSFKFNNKDLLVENFRGKINSSDFDMKGYFVNILAYAFIPGENIKIKADFSSIKLNMDDLLSNRKDKTGEPYRMKFSDKVNFDLNLSIREFAFGSFKAEHIRGNAIMKNSKLIVNETTLNAMEGKATFSGTIDGNYQDKFWMNLTAVLSDVNIQQLFFQFGEFGQQNITSNQLRGKIDATVYFKSFINQELTIDPNSLYALGDIIIREGELIRYSPLYKLSKYIKQKELEHIRFSTLKNQIEIKDQVVYIPEMDIESSTLNLKIFGSHSFKNKIDYHVRVLLSELLSKKEKKKEEEIEGIFTEDDGLGKTTLFLHMVGDAEDPDIKYDTKEVRKKLSADMQIEKKEIKNAFKREFGSKENNLKSDSDEDLTSQPLNGKDFKIEWEEDETEKVKKEESPSKTKTQPEKKSGKKEFIIEWDEENDTLK
jgi:hypothetical protein